MSDGDVKGAKLSIVLRHMETPDALAVLEPLWNALRDHHSSILPRLGGETPSRPPEEAWRLRRAQYERWLQEPGTFFILAEAAGETAGYAFVTIGPGLSAWTTGEKVAGLQTLSVLPQYRGNGLGGLLLEGVWRRLGDYGIGEMLITTAATNVDAQRFYEKRGLRRGFVVYYGSRQASVTGTSPSHEKVDDPADE
jgi:ribosomal protein S18 acetylase RimI-like enzyme